MVKVAVLGGELLDSDGDVGGGCDFEPGSFVASGLSLLMNNWGTAKSTSALPRLAIILASISFCCIGVSLCQSKSLIVSTFITFTGLSAMAVLTRTLGGCSFRMTCLEQVFPDPAEPTRRATILRERIRPFFIASLKRCLDSTVEIMRRKGEKRL